MTSGELIEISRKKLAIATVQAPRPKKNRINPGIANSRRKKIKPMMNHRTAALKKLSMIYIGFTKYTHLELRKYVFTGIYYQVHCSVKE